LKLEKKSCGGLHDDGEVKGCVTEVAGQIDSHLFGLENMLPAGAAEGDGEVVHIGLGVELSRRDRKVHQFETGQGTLDQLGYPLGRADFEELWRLAEKKRLSERRANAKDPACTPQATLVFDLSRVDITLRFVELERDGIGWSHNLEVTPDQRIQFFEG
jgi:hypothetical protein